MGGAVRGKRARTIIVVLLIAGLGVGLARESSPFGCGQPTPAKAFGRSSTAADDVKRRGPRQCASRFRHANSDLLDFCLYFRYDT